MRKLFTAFLLSCTMIGVSLPAGGAVEGEKRRLVVLADWGNDGPPAAVREVLNKHPKIKLAVAWPPAFALPEEMKPLLKGGRIEPALMLADEPLLPMLYETRVSSPVAVEFSWPEDVWNIVVRGQEELTASLPSGARGLYLRSGVFSEELAPGLRRLGISWANIDSGPELPTGAYLCDGFLVLAAGREIFTSPQEMIEWIRSCRGPPAVLLFDRDNPLTPEFLSAIAGYLDSDGTVMLTPGRLAQNPDGIAAIAGSRVIASDPGRWQARLPVLYRLAEARRAIEEYKNSGKARLKTLELLKDEIYHLYAFDTLAGLQGLARIEDEQVFQAGLDNIYRLLNKPVPGRITDAIAQAVPAAQESASFRVESGRDDLIFSNSLSTESAAGVRRFSVSVDTGSITYTVEPAAAPDGGSLLVDVYIDLNNQRGAGLTRLLPGVEAFMRPEDAWEFALRFQGNEASLYRSGRFAPTLIRTFRVKKPYAIDIPRALLRGNPLAWGYQVIAASGYGTPPVYTINDFICPEDGMRRELLAQPAVQLPALRAGGPMKE